MSPHVVGESALIGTENSTKRISGIFMYPGRVCPLLDQRWGLNKTEELPEIDIYSFALLARNGYEHAFPAIFFHFTPSRAPTLPAGPSNYLAWRAAACRCGLRQIAAAPVGRAGLLESCPESCHGQERRQQQAPRRLERTAFPWRCLGPLRPAIFLLLLPILRRSLQF